MINLKAAKIVTPKSKIKPMAKTGATEARGRFSPGQRVTLVPIQACRYIYIYIYLNIYIEENLRVQRINTPSYMYIYEYIYIQT